MDTFLHTVADELIRRFGWEGLKDTTLVFPMHRAGVVMRSELQKRMAAEHPAAMWAPETMALGDLFDSLCPLGKEDELFTVCRLHRIYCECLTDTHAVLPTDNSEPAPMDIDRFYGWGKQLLSDFTNIDQGINETEIESFFRNALTLSDLDAYKLDEEVRIRLEDLLYKGEARHQSLIAQSVQAHFAALWKAMPAIYSRLRNELEQAGKGYEGQRMRYVVTHWQELRQRATGKMYCFIGFNYLLPVERQLMQLLQDEGRAICFWDYIEDFRTNEKAFAFIRQNILHLPNALPAAKWGAARKVRTIAATSTHSEAQLAGQWLKNTYKHKGEQTAIVICDETQLEAVIYGLPPIHITDDSVTEDINITKGYPLRNTPVFSKVVRILHTADSRRPIEETLQKAVATVDEESQRSIQAPQNTWQWHLQRESLYQTRRALVQFIHILQDDIVDDAAAHPDLVVRLIRRHLEQITLPFHGEPITDLQIMGVLETRTMDFHHLLMLNVEEGIIPAHQPDKSFLPYYLRKAYGLQTHDERASIYAYNFFRLLNRAEDVTLIFSQSQTSMTKKTMSRFIMQMLVCPEEFEVEKYTLTESNTLQPAKTITIPDGAGWAQAKKEQAIQLTHTEKERAEADNLYLSPSAINTFYTCKRKFYLEYVLGVRESDEPENIFSNRTLGLFVHEAVHYLYEHHCHCDNKHAVRIHPNQIEAINTPTRRQEALTVAYERLNADYLRKHEGASPIYIPERHTMENRVIDRYIEHVLARDRYDAEHCGLTILLLESPQYTTIEIDSASSPLAPTSAPIRISLGGRLDRLDRIGGINGMPEQTRIVDYKCGKYDAKKMDAKENELRIPEKQEADYVRQTLLYSFVVYQNMQHANPEQPIAGCHSIAPHLYFTSQNLTSERARTSVSIDKTPILYDADSHKRFAALVRGMVEDILNEQTFQQCEACSQYCPFLRLCGRKPKAY